MGEGAVGLHSTHCVYFFLKLQTGFLGLRGQKVDAIDYYAAEIERLTKEVGTTF